MSDFYLVAQSYPAPIAAERIQRLSSHDSFEAARAAKDLENRGRDNTTAAVCVLREGAWWRLGYDGTVRGLLVKPDAPVYVDRCLCGGCLTQTEMEQGGVCLECGRSLSNLSSDWSEVEAHAENFCREPDEQGDRD
jgi:hypothetical protein